MRYLTWQCCRRILIHHSRCRIQVSATRGNRISRDMAYSEPSLPGPPVHYHVLSVAPSPPETDGDGLSTSPTGHPKNTEPHSFGEGCNPNRWAFMKETVGWSVWLADFAAIALPTTLVIVAISVLLLDGKPIESLALKRWQNAITAVNFCRHGHFLPAC